MGLIIKEICKEKGLSMGDLAQGLKITPVSLSQCLAGNPSLKRLQEIADVLKVDISELFERSNVMNIKGCVFVDEKPYVIASVQDLKDLLHKIS